MRDRSPVLIILAAFAQCGCQVETTQAVFSSQFDVEEDRTLNFVALEDWARSNGYAYSASSFVSVESGRLIFSVEIQAGTWSADVTQGDSNEQVYVQVLSENLDRENARELATLIIGKLKTKETRA